MRSSTRRGLPAAVGARIGRIRLQRELSRRVLAELAGIHQNTLKKIEGGQSNPTLTVLARIADALGVKLHDLICKS
ncbi:MAG: helix-turn-helix domain-containing protein [Acidobacteriota bacterium]|nr:helix-turn-helix domain-containing protein [Acidobacteriota bacterium]